MNATVRLSVMPASQLATTPTLPPMRHDPRSSLRGRRNRVMALALHRRDHGVCWRCGLYIHLTYPWTSRYALTIGHRIPLAQGGSNEPDNLAPEHRGCNLSGRPMQPRALIVTPR